jgi:hypothetical protein
VLRLYYSSLLFYSVLCQTILLVRGRVLPLNELKLTISHVTYACMWLHNFSCVLFISNSMVSCAIWKNIQSCEFFKLHLTFGLMQFWLSLRHSPMKIIINSAVHNWRHQNSTPRQDSGKHCNTWYKLYYDRGVRHGHMKRTRFRNHTISNLISWFLIWFLLISKRISVDL